MVTTADVLDEAINTLSKVEWCMGSGDLIEHDGVDNVNETCLLGDIYVGAVKCGLPTMRIGAERNPLIYIPREGSVVTEGTFTSQQKEAIELCAQVIRDRFNTMRDKGWEKNYFNGEGIEGIISDMEAQMPDETCFIFNDSYATSKYDVLAVLMEARDRARAL